MSDIAAEAIESSTSGVGVEEGDVASNKGSRHEMMKVFCAVKDDPLEKNSAYKCH